MQLDEDEERGKDGSVGSCVITGFVSCCRILANFIIVWQANSGSRTGIGGDL